VNYFAHGRRFVHDPYLLAGTAVPDWLSVADRRVRVRARRVAQWVDDPDPCVAAIARGVRQHQQDDDWFHRTRAFAELSAQFSAGIRRWLPRDDGFRPSFLGHILVEILLDAALIDEAPHHLDAYYQAVHSVDSQLVATIVNRMATRSTDRLPWLIELFRSERFLYDYRDDAKLLTRLNLIMRRVKLPTLPASLAAFLPRARGEVRQRQPELLAGEQASKQGNVS
jgi:hypothetical protein